MGGGPRKHDKKIFSRGWFRSIDLWVMGPARSHCATLLGNYWCILPGIYHETVIWCNTLLVAMVIVLAPFCHVLLPKFMIVYTKMMQCHFDCYGYYHPNDYACINVIHNKYYFPYRISLRPSHLMKVLPMVSSLRSWTPMSRVVVSSGSLYNVKVIYLSAARV